LIACMLSIRTRDEVSLVAARRLFAVARTPFALDSLSAAEIDARIADVTFHERKAGQIKTIAGRVQHEFGGLLPTNPEEVMAFPGVGPKCTNLALGIASGLEAISVDIHVHRITNRWGYVHEPTPERTMAALENVLPKHYWLEINALLVPFGKWICTGVRPICSTCPVLEMCRQIGVNDHR
jgi:endonuclease III